MVNADIHLYGQQQQRRGKAGGGSREMNRRKEAEPTFSILTTLSSTLLRLFLISAISANKGMVFASLWSDDVRDEFSLSPIAHSHPSAQGWWACRSPNR